MTRFWMIKLSGFGCCADGRIYFLFLWLFYFWSFAMMRNHSNNGAHNQKQLINVAKAEIITQPEPQIPDEFEEEAL